MRMFGDGKCSEDFSIYLTEEPEIPSSKKKWSETEVPGRLSGALNTFNGYSDLEQTISFAAMSLDHVKYIIRNAKSWLSTLKEVYFDDDPNFYYRVKKMEISSINNEWSVSGDFTVKFTYYPFLYERTRVRSFTSHGILLRNPSSVLAQPLIKLFGNGELKLTINDASVSFKNIKDFVVIDCELMIAYRNTTSLDENMTGAYPMFEPGINNIVTSSNVTKTEINARWCFE